MTAWVIAFLTLIPTENGFACYESCEFYLQQTDTIQHIPRILKCASAFNRRPYHIIDNEEDYKLLTGFYKGDGCPGNPEIDFDKEVLIGYPFDAGGKDPDVTMVLRKVRGKVNGDLYILSTPDVHRIAHPDVFWFTVSKSEPISSIYFEQHRIIRNGAK